MNQVILNKRDSVKQIDEILRGMDCQKTLVVCDGSYQYLSIKEDIDGLKTPCVFFSDFTSNPLYEDVCRGVDLFRAENCDSILAVGGGSSIDVAKCVKLYCRMDRSRNYLEQDCADTGVPLLAVPTTAGTGSESTRYAVIYYEGKKQSVAHESIVPDYAILDSSALRTLPVYQKKCTLLDALCQGIESWWSVNSTDESKKYSGLSVGMIMKNYKAYLSGDEEAAGKTLLAANYAGRAINIAQTTAAHAMSYKLTSLYGLPHGHAAAVCLAPLWEHMTDNISECADPRGSAYLSGVFHDIADSLGEESAYGAAGRIRAMLEELEIQNPVKRHDSDIDILTRSVNSVRLKNNPIALNEDELRKLYERIVGEK